MLLYKLVMFIFWVCDSQTWVVLTLAIRKLFSYCLDSTFSLTSLLINCFLIYDTILFFVRFTLPILVLNSSYTASVAVKKGFFRMI